MKRSLDEILNDFPGVVDRNIPAPEFLFAVHKKTSTKKSLLFYLSTITASVLILLAILTFYSPTPTMANKVIFNGFACPNENSMLTPEKNDREKINEHIDEIIRTVYYEPMFNNYEIKSMELAPDSPGGWKGIIEHYCSEKTYHSSWIVQISFPDIEPISASLSAGQLFITKTIDGWVVWERYH